MIGILKVMMPKSKMEMTKKPFLYTKWHLKLTLIMQMLISVWQVARKLLDSMNSLFKTMTNS